MQHLNVFNKDTKITHEIEKWKNTIQSQETERNLWKLYLNKIKFGRIHIFVCCSSTVSNRRIIHTKNADSALFMSIKIFHIFNLPCAVHKQNWWKQRGKKTPNKYDLTVAATTNRFIYRMYGKYHWNGVKEFMNYR